MAADKKLLASILGSEKGPTEDVESEDVESDGPAMGAAEMAVEEFSAAIQDGDAPAATDALRAAIQAILGED